MPPHRGGAPPGPSPGPQDAYSADLLFPTLLMAAIKNEPGIAQLDPQHLRRTFRSMWTVHPPPPNDIEAASAILLAAARRVARATECDNDPFKTAPQATPSASTCVLPEGSPASAGLPDLTFPHIDPSGAAPVVSPSSAIPPSTKSLLAALLKKDQDDFKALDDESLSLLRDLANRLFRFLQQTPSGTPSGAPKSLPVHTASVAVQPVDPLTKPASPPPRPPRSPTRPPPRVARPPPARSAAPPPKQSYAKAAASAPAAPAVAPAVLMPPAPPSKTAALRKSCIRQGTKATKVIICFPTPSTQPSVNQLWGTLATFKPTDIACTLHGDFVLTFPQVLDSDDHAILAKKLKKVYAVDIQVLNQGRHRSSSFLLCRPATRTAPQSLTSSSSKLSRATPSGRTWNSSRSHGSSFKPVRLSASQLPSSSKLPMIALHQQPNDSSRPTYYSTRSLDAAALGPSLWRPSSAASACGGVTRPTTAPPNRPGAMSAPGITNQAPTWLSLRMTSKLKLLSASTASAIMGRPPAYAPSIGRVSTRRSW